MPSCLSFKGRCRRGRSNDVRKLRDQERLMQLYDAAVAFIAGVHGSTEWEDLKAGHSTNIRPIKKYISANDCHVVGGRVRKADLLGRSYFYLAALFGLSPTRPFLPGWPGCLEFLDFQFTASANGDRDRARKEERGEARGREREGGRKYVL